MNRPSLRELECFVAVGEELHFSRAAKRLRMSQPPLSRHIQDLEERVGCALFRRTRRRVELTPAGAAFLEEARRVLNQIDHAVFQVASNAGADGPPVRLGFVGAMLAPDFLDRLQAMRRALPATRFMLDDLSPGDQLIAMREHRLDGGFIGAPPRRLPADCEVRVWKAEPLMVCAPPGHALAREKTANLADLAGEPWVMLARSAAPDFYRFVMDLCRGAKIHPRVVQEAQRAPAALSLVAVGTGITVVTETAVRLIKRGLVIKPLADPGAVLQHAFVWSTAAGAPVETLRQIADILAQPS